MSGSPIPQRDHIWGLQSRAEPDQSDGHHTVPALLSVDDVAKALGLDQRFVRRLVFERRIAYFKIGRYVRFDANDVARWIAAARVEPAPAPTPASRRSS